MSSICCILPSQVIVEKAPKARIGDLDKKKYLVPSDLTGKLNSMGTVLPNTWIIGFLVECNFQNYLCGAKSNGHPSDNSPQNWNFSGHIFALPAFLTGKVKLQR